MTDSAFLDCSYFADEVATIARDLIGRTLVVNSADGARSGVVTETEAYGGADDVASHAAFRPGGRAAIMFSYPGRVYVYAAYGMYPCFNIVTGPEGTASAVLIRGVQVNGDRFETRGPGRVARALGISNDDHGLDVCTKRFRVTNARLPYVVQATPRIGITRGIDTLWRFVGIDDREAGE